MLGKRQRSGFLRDERGLVTIEWIMISAVVVLASIAITSFVLNGAGQLGSSVATKLQSAIPDDGH